ncbi:alpha/beta fold hydrolase [Paenibacillus antri]|uniref:Alpha/beta fold hydrolase n=1 Tax=Paenibacillus antri TaxID=2582848 RepID=A0A5R9GJ91_9BACL|nr:alpha/beta fold hydrolase [Paenibacillus antri]TLS51665.1 alpha/beta fold hydrolase [Paenibacillus antri]
MKKLAVGLTAAVAIVSSGLAIPAEAAGDPATTEIKKVSAAHAVALPDTTGDYQVGTTNFDWVDLSRKESFTLVPDDHRELMVQVWYPIDSVEGFEKETYIPSPANGIESVAASLGMGPQFSAVNEVDTGTYKDALLSDEESKYPIVLFSHGLGRARWEYQSITRELASHGYIVFSIDHTYMNFGTEFKDGRFVPLSPSLVPDFKAMDDYINQVWVKDLQFVVRKLAVLNRTENKLNLKNKLDLAKIAAIGHSFGGATSARALQVEPKIKAAVNMDGSFVGLSTESGAMTKPFAFLKTEAHAKDLSGENELPPTPPGMDPRVIADQFKEYAVRYEKAVEGDAYDITIAGTTHFDHLSFTDHPVLKPYYQDGTPFFDNGKNPNDFYELANSLLLSFLDKHLRGKSPTLFDAAIVQ